MITFYVVATQFRDMSVRARGTKEISRISRGIVLTTELVSYATHMMRDIVNIAIIQP